jgi:hypothetical protein
LSNFSSSLSGEFETLACVLQFFSLHCLMIFKSRSGRLAGAIAAAAVFLNSFAYGDFPMSHPTVSGFDPGQRRLNGPQTTGRIYRNLSEATHTRTRDDDVRVPMRDGLHLLADVHRPVEPGRYPVLIAASPYPRQIQDLGAPAGFIEAGASDFFVPAMCISSPIAAAPGAGLPDL